MVFQPIDYWETVRLHREIRQRAEKVGDQDLVDMIRRRQQVLANAAGDPEFTGGRIIPFPGAPPAGSNQAPPLWQGILAVFTVIPFGMFITLYTIVMLFGKK